MALNAQVTYVQTAEVQDVLSLITLSLQVQYTSPIVMNHTTHHASAISYGPACLGTAWSVFAVSWTAPKQVSADPAEQRHGAAVLS